MTSFPVKSDLDPGPEYQYSINLKDLENMENIHVHGTDWEIVYIPTKDIVRRYHDHIGGLFYEKMINYGRAIKRGCVFPPIIVSADNVILDGQCRHAAHRYAKRKKIACLRAVRDGTGLILKDEVYKGGRFIKANDLSMIWITYED